MVFVGAASSHGESLAPLWMPTSVLDHPVLHSLNKGPYAAPLFV